MEGLDNIIITFISVIIWYSITALIEHKVSTQLMLGTVNYEYKFKIIVGVWSGSYLSVLPLVQMVLNYVR